VIVTNIKTGGALTKPVSRKVFIITSVDGVDYKQCRRFRKSHFQLLRELYNWKEFLMVDGVYKYPLNLEENK